MDTLSKRHCVPCEDPHTPPLTNKEVEQYLSKLKKGWKSVDDKKIEKNYAFVNFKMAIAFVNEVSDIAEYEGHHPDISIHNFNKVTINLSTHSIKGLTENDFIIAAKIDEIEVGI